MLFDKSTFLLKLLIVIKMAVGTERKSSLLMRCLKALKLALKRCKILNCFVFEPLSRVILMAQLPSTPFHASPHNVVVVLNLVKAILTTSVLGDTVGVGTSDLRHN